ncbi:glycosyl transferase [Rhizocola hellebori]|uniref:Glycosyl transferase n=2 Tax=Rhizocola hellebori TaxID=1392758 RepID=A0A8J3Q8L5_9ACTN|nr:DUF2064 domain-containing protein [Rhizocola hellebori]GIH05228.1 glycosyl transferase [Rhizocola hellebori]
MNTQIVVVAKEPMPGSVKTRLCPPCTPEQAALLAEAALTDTLAVAGATPAGRRVLLLHGDYRPPPGWDVVAQRGEGLGVRLANGFADTAAVGLATLLIGMDTPQVTADLLGEVADGLSSADAVLCAAEDGGWWALALRDARAAVVLQWVPMSQPDTGKLTFEALTSQGLRVHWGPVIRDVDTADDLSKVAALCPGGGFAAAVSALGMG